MERISKTSLFTCTLCKVHIAVNSQNEECDTWIFWDVRNYASCCHINHKNDLQQQWHDNHIMKLLGHEKAISQYVEMEASNYGDKCFRGYSFFCPKCRILLKTSIQGSLIFLQLFFASDVMSQIKCSWHSCLLLWCFQRILSLSQSCHRRYTADKQLIALWLLKISEIW